MKNENLLPIVKLFVDDGIFRYNEMLSAQKIWNIEAGKIKKFTKFINCGNSWQLSSLKMKEEYVKAFEQQGEKLGFLQNRHLVWILDLRKGNEHYVALYVNFSGKIIILLKEYFNYSRCWFGSDLVLISDKTDDNNQRKVVRHYVFSAFNYWFFVKEIVTIFADNGAKPLCECKYVLQCKIVKSLAI